MKLKKVGFTLIESLIVMLILAGSMTAALYLLTTVVFGTQQNLARTKAVYLAQECHELARNLRDTAWLNFENWDCAFGVPGDEFIVSHQPAGFNVSSCNNFNANVLIQSFSTTPDNSVLYQNGALINHETAGIDSGYRRKVRHIDPDSSSDTLDLSCEVDWQFNGRDQNITTTQTLTNWRRN